jgi:hypothetical protein
MKGSKTIMATPSLITKLRTLRGLMGRFRLAKPTVAAENIKPAPSSPVAPFDRNTPAMLSSLRSKIAPHTKRM